MPMRGQRNDHRGERGGPPDREPQNYGGPSNYAGMGSRSAPPRNFSGRTAFDDGQSDFGGPHATPHHTPDLSGGNHGFEGQSNSADRTGFDHGQGGWRGTGNYGGASYEMNDRSRGPKGYKRSDDRIREDVCEALGDGSVDAREVEVSVTDGHVTLRGTVHHRRDKRTIEDIAEGVRGVVDISNELKIGPPTADRTDPAAKASRPS